jgi:2-hydroxychromene-2-carboxylate isomerase
MAMPASTLRFFFDYLSPYAYLGWTQIHALAERFAVTVEPVPVLFAGLLDAHGTRGPAETPARRRYLIRDVARLAHRMGVPLALPPAHPFNPLMALRVSSLPMSAEQRRALIDGLFAAAWGSGVGVSDPETVDAIASRVGLPARASEAAASAEVKARLRDETAAAVREGVFGVPTVLVGGQMFWGCDSLSHLEYFLGHGDVVAPDLVERWERLPASAVRPASTKR